MRVRVACISFTIIVTLLPNLSLAESPCRRVRGEERNACLREEIATAQAQLAYWDDVKRDKTKRNKIACQAQNAAKAGSAAKVVDRLASDIGDERTVVAGGAGQTGKNAAGSGAPPASGNGACQ